MVGSAHPTTTAHQRKTHDTIPSPLSRLAGWFLGDNPPIRERERRILPKPIRTCQVRNHLLCQHHELPVREQISNFRLVEVMVRNAAFVSNIVNESPWLNFYSLSGEIRLVRLECDHQDAGGFILRADDNEIYRQFQGTETGGITLKVGDELDVLTVFINHHGEEISFGFEEADDHHGEDEGDGHGEGEVFNLALTGYDSSIIEVHLPESEEHEEGEDMDEDHAEGFAFEVTGLRVGQSGIKLQLLHGDHADFTAALRIPVNVSP